MWFIRQHCLQSFGQVGCAAVRHSRDGLSLRLSIILADAPYGSPVAREMTGHWPSAVRDRCDARLLRATYPALKSDPGIEEQEGAADSDRGAIDDLGPR